MLDALVSILDVINAALCAHDCHVASVGREDDGGLFAVLLALACSYHLGCGYGLAVVEYYALALDSEIEVVAVSSDVLNGAAFFLLLRWHEVGNLSTVFIDSHNCICGAPMVFEEEHIFVVLSRWTQYALREFDDCKFCP